MWDDSESRDKFKQAVASMGFSSSFISKWIQADKRPRGEALKKFMDYACQGKINTKPALMIRLIFFALHERKEALQAVRSLVNKKTSYDGACWKELSGMLYGWDAFPDSFIEMFNKNLWSFNDFQLDIIVHCLANPRKLCPWILPTAVCLGFAVAETALTADFDVDNFVRIVNMIC
jgi:hypothetical protein